MEDADDVTNLQGTQALGTSPPAIAALLAEPADCPRPLSTAVFSSGIWQGRRSVHRPRAVLRLQGLPLLPAVVGLSLEHLLSARQHWGFDTK